MPSKRCLEILKEAEDLILLSDVTPFSSKNQLYDYLMQLGLKKFIVDNKNKES